MDLPPIPETETQADGPIAGPELASYLEKVIADAYKREFDQEENVWRTLPLFATSIGLVAGLATLLHTALKPIDGTWFPYVSYGGLAGMYVSLFVLLFFLFQSTKRRKVKAPSEETALRGKAAEYAEYYRTGGAAPEDVDKLAALDFRELMIRQMSVAAMSLRRNNLDRITARARAVYTLGVALLFVFVLTIAIFVNDGLKEPTNGSAFGKGCGATATNCPD